MINRLFVLLFFFFCSAANALDLELTQGINAALPIGINSFGGGEPSQAIKSIVENDLRFSGQFRLVAPQGGESMPIGMWKQAGADSVLSGKVNSLGGNQLDVSYQLMDAAAQRPLLTKSYQISTNELRDLAHHISDEVYEKLTGEKGIFSTRIAYIVVQRNGEKTRYSLEIADVDGYNPQSLLVSSEPIMSPTWSPDGRQIAYVSFEKKRAQIFTVSVETGKRRLLTNFPGINGAPSWSPNGKELAVVLSKGGAPKIYSVSLADGSMKQLTFGDAIDTEPRYSPDGKYILFTSGRGGRPQVYRLTLADGSVSRVTYEGNYNARASFTPNQKQVVMLHREDRNFNIGVQNLDSGHITTLTFSSMDESPSLSPNGKLILYATHENDKGVLAIVSIDGRIKMRLPSKDGDVQEPAWSPYLG
ncbi:TolB colicin import protein (plasmid) [Legionella adelaidensis]|uniref:Tol-Pal system protein TolB n=1 Tax=Legionella adelaidensis TaxID=45056 RepID=A0A448NBU1_9GAMM|nr:Tol-Pal system beta propeller repeat protein TolB [Legionella adelaidensis]VEH85374.1 TolB colicin import protein [Legionella adelaidensis]